MARRWILDGYRELTENEQLKMEQAIIWLSKRGIGPEKIAFASVQNLDREGKTIHFLIETRFFAIERNIGYSGTPLDLYLTEVFPCLKSNRFLFPKWAWAGRRPELCGHIAIEQIQQILADYREGRLLTKRLSFDRMKVSKVNLHINY